MTQKTALDDQRLKTPKKVALSSIAKMGKATIMRWIIIGTEITLSYMPAIAN